MVEDILDSYPGFKLVSLKKTRTDDIRGPCSSFVKPAIGHRLDLWRNGPLVVCPSSSCALRSTRNRPVVMGGRTSSKCKGSQVPISVSKKRVRILDIFFLFSLFLF